ncbi:MAG: nucleoid-associated protein [Candidatus Eremiobacteraeota bacterium]|nr:nucleoid-associated protein [Candidatus Eremiobacteraeota bacterium]
MAFLSDDERNTLKIKRAIFHVVGPADTDFVPLDVAFDPGPHAEFFLDRIYATAQGATCDFRDDSGVLAAVLRMEKAPRTFVAETRKLARDFALAHHGNAKKGVFLVFALTSSSGSLYAMLKLDHQTVLAYHLSRKQGITSAEIEELVQTFVRSADALQKGAVVRIRAGSKELVVHDQANKRGISAYFEDFLGSRRRFSDADLTKTVVDIAAKVAIAHETELAPDIRKNVRTRIYGAAESAAVFGPEEPSFVAAAFGALPENSPIAISFDRELKRAGIENERFTLDPALTPRPTRRKLVTKENVEIRYPDAFREHITFRKREDGVLEIVIPTDGIVEDDVSAEQSRRGR